MNEFSFYYIKVMKIMFGLRILKLAKFGLLTSVAIMGIGGVSHTFAGDVSFPPPDMKPNYPAPIMQQGQMQSQYQEQSQSSSQGEFMASVDVSASYYRYEVHSGAEVSTYDQQLVELRPFFAYSMDQNGIEFGASFYSTLSYEFGGTPAYALGRSEVDLLVKKAGDFAFGVTGGYNNIGYVSESPTPIGASTYQSIDVSAFAEKRMGQFGLSLSGSYLKDSYADTPQFGDWTYDESDKDNSVYGATLRVNYHFDQALSAFAEASYTRKQFVITPAPNRNETAYGIRVGGTYNFNNEVALEVAGQYGYHAIDCGCTTQAFGGDAKLVASLGANLTGLVSAEAEYTKSTDAALDSVSMRIGGEISYAATTKIDISAGAHYGVAFSGPNEGKDIGADMKVNYAVTGNVDIFADASASHQSQVGAGFTRSYGASLGASLHL